MWVEGEEGTMKIKKGFEGFENAGSGKSKVRKRKQTFQKTKEFGKNFKNRDEKIVFCFALIKVNFLNFLKV